MLKAQMLRSERRVVQRRINEYGSPAGEMAIESSSSRSK